MSKESHWLTLAKRLDAIAATGLAYTKDPYKIERYEEIQKIAHEIMADLGDVPIEKIESLIKPFSRGYETPKSEVRAVVVQENKVLLVQEKADGLWTLPGGFADVGLSPMENTVKEVKEEAGIDVKATHLFALRHKAKWEYDPSVMDFYKMIFICEPLTNEKPTPGYETLAANYFSVDDLPALSTGRTIKRDITEALEFVNLREKLAVFD